MKKEPAEEFANPGSFYRGAPFWAWNGKLEPGEMRRQIRLMKRMGLGGFFMHARVGLDTEYLSEEWFDNVRACVDEAEKQGMKAWLYDEDRWPSGSAGGIVTKNPAHRRKYMVCRRLSGKKGLDKERKTAALFAAKMSGEELKSYRRISEREAGSPAKDETLLQFFVKAEEPTDWYNGQTYLDTLSVEAVREFINVTYEAYKKRVGKHFGKSVPGIFTDEPNFIGGFGLEADGDLAAQWTDKFAETFKKRHGYDIVDRLPEVAFDLSDGELSKARLDYFDCATHLFTEAFGREIGEWCGRNNISYTGHLLYEDTLSGQSSCAGACMRFYEHMQIPGMDELTEYWEIYDTAKQLSSAARQFGRRWRLSETYGCSGWDFPFAGHKAVGDWQAALGVNIRCQHLAWQTMEGEAKRDYPASIFYQSPWWESYSKVEDYFARVNMVMSKGEDVRDLLVVHPIESAWMLMAGRGRTSERTRDFDRDFIRLRKLLLDASIDFDYGDEELLSRHGGAGKDAGEAVLKMALAKYKAVVLPPMKTIRSTTLELLRKFKGLGGVVVFAGEIPSHVDGGKSGAAADFAAGCPRLSLDRPGEITRAVEANARRVSITGKNGKPLPGMLHLLKEDKDAYHIFVCNTGVGERPTTPEYTKHLPPVRERKVVHPEATLTLSLDAAGDVVELDPETGAAYKAEQKKSAGKIVVQTSFPWVGSRMFTIPKKAVKAAGLPKRKKFARENKTPVKSREWDVTLSEENVLALDFPAYKIGGAQWKKPSDILQIDREARKAVGARPRGGQMVQPWARVKKANPAQTKVGLRYMFEADAKPSGALWLGIENPERFEISLNGAPVCADMECGWWCDRSLKRLPLDPNTIRVGQNELLLSVDYDEYFPGLEIIYLIGNFGVKMAEKKPVVTDPVSRLKIGDWVPQGLAFYSGNVSYIKNVEIKAERGESVFLQLPEYRGVAASVHVNGQKAGTTAWGDNEVELTGLVKDGANEIRIEILGHRRNSHGPLHHTEKSPLWTGPGTFTPEADNWSDDYQLVACGILADPVIIRRR